MRLNPRGEIVPCNYDFNTCTIGHLRVPLPIAYAEPFTDAASHWTRHDLWKALVELDDAIAVLIVNNVFLVVVTKVSMIIHTKADRMQPQVAVADVTLAFTPTKPVGFVRTCPEVKDVNVPPYLLYADEFNRVSIAGKPLQILRDAVPCSEIQLYKMLITTTRPAIYMSAVGPKYL